MGSDSSVSQVYRRAAQHRLTECQSRIKHCVDQLTDEQVWWRPRDDMNSIANLLLHLSGNVTQWIIAGVGGVPDQRNRAQEFAERGPLAKDELIHQLENTVQQATQVIADADDESLTARHQIQGFDETGLSAILESVAHFAGHTQEIVHITREQLGEEYDFAWSPTTPEQGAPT